MTLLLLIPALLRPALADVEERLHAGGGAPGAAPQREQPRRPAHPHALLPPEPRPRVGPGDY